MKPAIKKEIDAKKEYEKRIKNRQKVSKKINIQLQKYLVQSGIKSELRDIKRISHQTSSVVCLIAAITFIPINFLVIGGNIYFYFVILATIATLFYLLIKYLLLTLFFVYVDLRKFHRTLELERVLPEFLLQASSNMDAGLPVDQALWFAVSNRFGILEKEIEHIAKNTYVGTDLEDALLEFSEKYDSILLKRTITLIIEGITAGGNLAELLKKVALDIQDNRIMRKEMAASTTSYVIFIIMSSVIFAPLLFALSGQLLSIVKEIVATTNSSAGTNIITLALNAEAISMFDFKIFALLYLVLTSITSLMIVSTIRKGNVKESLKFLPITLLVSISIFLISGIILNNLMGGVFS